MDWAGIWNDIVTYFQTNVWNIVFFFVILILGIIIIKIIMTVLRKVLGKTRMERIAQQFICTAVKFCLWLVLILILLSQIGIQISGILTAISALILAVGMALESNMANLANGIVIVSNHMFKKGDYIIVDGVEGNITDINFLFTTLLTSDNKKITLPNSTIVNSSVTNLGANAKRRVDFTFSVAYESDVELVKKLVTDVMKSDGRVYLDPAPFCRLKTMNASSLDFSANCWCDNEDYWDVYYYVMEWVYNEFKRNKVSVPYNQLEVRERKDNVNAPVIGKKLPERVEKVREAKKDKDVFNLLKKGLTKHEKKAKKKKKDKKQEIVTDKNILALSNLENATKSETQEENIVKVASVQEATNEKVEDKQEEKVEEKKSKRKKK
ncbi:MAG TPA: mechanosensitive ion channel family protein [Candidatus Caccovivens faecavium]|nr:mechanosensitive ion channel family protein [Candidatus Caccovivens faecavium]